MARTLNEFTGVGNRSTYPVSFSLGFIQREHVYVYSGDLTEYNNQLSYTWLNSNTIELSEPLPDGQVMYIRRVVPRDELVNDYEDGAILKESNLDASFLQTLMIIEEIQDGFFVPNGFGNVTFDENNDYNIMLSGYTYTKEEIDSILDSVTGGINLDASKILFNGIVDYSADNVEDALETEADLREANTVRITALEGNVNSNNSTLGNLVPRVTLLENEMDVVQQRSLNNSVSVSSLSNIKANRASNPVAGNLAGIDAQGDVTDSGKSLIDLATATQGALAENAVQPTDNISILTNDAGYINSLLSHSINELSDVDTTGKATGRILEFDASGNLIVGDKTAGATTTFVGLSDTPSAYAGQAGKLVTVNNTEDGVEFVDVVGAGLVDSVFGRVGSVVAVTGDYNSDQITNNSSVTGISVSDALEAVEAAIPNVSGKMDKLATPTVDAIVTQDAFGNAKNSGVLLSSLATAQQGSLADSAVQPADLATVATSGLYSDLTGAPNLSTVATTGAYSDLTGTPTLATVSSTGSYTDLINVPTTFTPSAHTHVKADITDFSDADYATAAQGALANTAVQPGDLATVATTGDYNDLVNTPSDLSKSIRKSLLDSPLCRLFCPNKVVDTLAGPLTWTRTTTATYVDRYGIVRTAAIDEPREESDGWLIEGASTNICLHSEDFSNALWQKSGTGVSLPPSVTPNFSTAPDGTLTADRIVFDLNGGNTSSDLSQIEQAASTSEIDTCSVWLKSNTGGDVNLTLSSKTGEVNFITVGNTWKRFEVTSSDVGVGTFRIRLRGSEPSTGGQADVLVWGAQLEQLPFASSYIPTTTAPATRARDVVYTDISNNFLSGVEGDWSYSVNLKLLGSANHTIFGSPNAIGNFEYSAIVASTGSVFFRDMSNANSAAASNPTGSLAVALSGVRDGTLLTQYLNGAAGNPSSPTSTTGFNFNEKVYLGSSISTGFYPLYGHLKDFRIYDFALNADEVQFLVGVK